MKADGSAAHQLRVSLVATVLNEYGSLPGWLEGLADQTRLPDQCLIVDGGSSDGTLELLQAAALPFPVTIIEDPGANISVGRNRAIRQSSGDVVVVTDAGTKARPDWLEQLVLPFEKDEAVDVAAGFFEATGHSLWGRSLGAVTLPDSREVNPEAFLPSSRSVAVRKRWFDHGFQYPEWLDYCEDLIIDLQLRRAGALQVFVPGAVVRFEPRRGPVGFFRQYYRYARGDGKAGLFARRHLIRYASYSMAVVVLCQRKPLEIAATFILGLAYFWRPAHRYRQRLRADERHAGAWVAIPLMIFQRTIGDVAKMAGYPVGLAWRIRRDRDWRLWRSGWANRLPGGSLRRF